MQHTHVAHTAHSDAQLTACELMYSCKSVCGNLLLEMTFNKQQAEGTSPLSHLGPEGMPSEGSILPLSGCNHMLVAVQPCLDLIPTLVTCAMLFAMLSVLMRLQVSK